jgi:hypothetical protein
MFKRISVLVLLCLLSTAGLLSAEDQITKENANEQSPKELNNKQTKQSGVVDLEPTDTKKTNNYMAAQDGSIQYLQELKKNIDLLKTDQNATLSLTGLSKDQLLYFTSAYLLCISKKGSCTFILDAVMESDFQIICNPNKGNCQKPKQVACTNMNGFWKTWLAYDFEQRQSHMLPVGLMGENNRFRQEEFPNYLRCNNTLIKPLTAVLSGKQSLHRRYEINQNIVSNIEKTSEFFESIKKNVGNIFQTLGVQQQAENKQVSK